MSNNVGLWIDHVKAVIVFISDKGDETVSVSKGVGQQLRRRSDLPMEGSFESQLVPADDTQLRKYKIQLRHFYDEVVDKVKKAKSVYIFGPGEAKGEFKKCLVKNKLKKRIIKVETSDKMTRPQVIAKIRKHFSN